MIRGRVLTEQEAVCLRIINLMGKKKNLGLGNIVSALEGSECHHKTGLLCKDEER